MKIQLTLIAASALVLSAAGCSHLPWRRSQQTESAVAEKWIDQAASEVKYRDPEIQHSDPRNMGPDPEVDFARSSGRQTSSGGSCCH